MSPISWVTAARATKRRRGRAESRSAKASWSSPAIKLSDRAKGTKKKEWLSKEGKRRKKNALFSTVVLTFFRSLSVWLCACVWRVIFPVTCTPVDPFLIPSPTPQTLLPALCSPCSPLVVFIQSAFRQRECLFFFFSRNSLVVARADKEPYFQNAGTLHFCLALSPCLSSSVVHIQTLYMKNHV